MNKILKLSKNEYYEVLDNDGKICDYCSFCGNLGNCWLACNGYHCDIDNKNLFINVFLIHIIDSIQTHY